MSLERKVKNIALGLASLSLAANINCSYDNATKASQDEYQYPSLEEVSQDRDAYVRFREILKQNKVEDRYIPSQEDVKTALSDPEFIESLNESRDYIEKFVEDYCNKKKKQE